MDKIIHVIGDSHTSIFSGKNNIVDTYHISKLIPHNEQFSMYRIGACTANGILQQRQTISEILNLYVNKDKDTVMFCFGEIDCRVHLSKLIFVQGKPFEVIGPVVNEYFNTIMYYKQLGYDIVIWGVSPSHNSEILHDKSFGTNLERNFISRVFNNYLESLCEENNIPFVCLFDELLLPDGQTDMRYFDGWVHLNLKAYPMILQELKNNYIR